MSAKKVKAILTSAGWIIPKPGQWLEKSKTGKRIGLWQMIDEESGMFRRLTYWNVKSSVYIIVPEK